MRRGVKDRVAQSVCFAMRLIGIGKNNSRSGSLQSQRATYPVWHVTSAMFLLSPPVTSNLVRAIR